MKKKVIRIKWKNVFLLLIILASLILLVISLLNIFNYKFESNHTNKQVENINNNIEIKEIIDNDQVEIINNDNHITKANPYWDYISENLIDVDFNELKKINQDLKGWLQLKGTNINYPFVQSKDNAFYLTHSFDKSWNSAGWVFLDYRNDISNYNDKNTIIYAHGMKNKTMFGSLRNILTSGWLNNIDNHILKISTEYENTLWQVFSVYRIPTTSDYIQTTFVNDEEYKTFLNTLKERSAYDFNTSISEKDRIITLSTCYNNDDKVVLHAKLIKKESKTN